MKARGVPEPELVKQVGIWIRVSTEDQARGESPQHHEQRARYYAEARGWRVREVYRLEGVSGKDVRSHPEAERMMKDVRTGRITGLVFSKLARLARSTRDLLDFADFFREYEADLVSLQEAIDTSTPAGRLFYTMIAAMAQWEREEIASRVAASIPIRAKLGKPLGGAAPFGYRWEGRELVPDPKEAPVRKLIYDLFLEHRRKGTVARLLNDAGYRTRNGFRWTDTTITRLLRDPTAKGVRRANYTRRADQSKGWVLKPETEWVLSSCPPLVSEDLWTHANAVLEEGMQKGRRKGRPPLHPFTGVASCACGQKLYVPSNSRKYTCYRCRNKIPMDDLEAIFAEQLKSFVFSPDEIVRHLAEADEAIREKEEVLRVLASERDRVGADMDRVMKLYLGDQLSQEGFGREYRPLEARLHEIEAELPRLQAEVDFLKIQYLSRNEIVTQAQDLYGRWGDLSADAKRQIVETIAERITVDRDEVRIDLCYWPTPVPPPSGPSRPSPKIMAERQRNAVPALPFCHLQLTARKPASSTSTNNPAHLGDHLRMERQRTGLLQQEAAACLGVTPWTLSRWEGGKAVPPVRFMPGIIAFLGYSPWIPATSFGARFMAARRAHGLSRKQLGALLGVVEPTVQSWEENRTRPGAGLLERIEAVLGSTA